MIWSTDCLNEKAKQAHILAYDNEENDKSLNIPLGCEVTTFCVEDLIGMPFEFTEGFLRVPRAYLGDGAIGFSLVSSPFFNGAAQTLLGLEGQWNNK